LDLQNQSELEDWLKFAEIKYKFGEYKRLHITELITAGCESAIESLGFYTDDYYSLMYYIHTILTSLFMDWEQQADFFKYLHKTAQKQVKAYKEKEEKPDEN
jgi:hypothetical protein